MVNRTRNLPAIRVRRAREMQRIFAGHDSLRNHIDLPVANICVAIQQQPFARACPQNRRGAAFYRALDNRRRQSILIEKSAHVDADYLDDTSKIDPFTLAPAFAKSSSAPFADINQIRFDSARWRRRRPPRGDQTHRKLLRAENFQPVSPSLHEWAS